MRARMFQKPKIKNKGGYWIAQFRDLGGTKRKVSLGPVAKVKKADAESKLAAILEPINKSAGQSRVDFEFGSFVQQVYLPFYRRKWKPSTARSNEDRLQRHLVDRFEQRSMKTFSRDELQHFLDEKAKGGLSFSVVAHLRWDLSQIFRMAATEGHTPRNPAHLLFVPKEARRVPTRRMSLDQVKIMFSILPPRERLIAGLAVLVGLRPGEIFGLRRKDVDNERVNVERRVYRGQVDTPKTFNSRREAAIGGELLLWLAEWLAQLPEQRPDEWLFPSEKSSMPLSRDNVWRRYFQPGLKTVGLEWVNFQVLRRTHASLLDGLGIDPQVRADQMGHSVDVNQNRYTRASLERRRSAVNALEAALKLK